MNGKGIVLLAVLMAAMTLLSATSLALPNVTYVKINGDKFESGDNLVVERGEELDFKVKLQGVEDESDLEVEVDLLGYEYNDVSEISDSTHTFDIYENETIYKTLSIRVPENAEKDTYDLRVRIGGRTGSSVEYLYKIILKSARHSLTIKDIIFSPEGEVMSGRALLSTVRIKNVGEKDEESVKISVSIPALGISASDYIDELEEEESLTSEELYLRIPSCTEEGIYNVKVEVTFDDGYETVSKSSTIRVVEDESCYAAPETEQEQAKPEKTLINIGSTNMDLVKGEAGVIYPITISNSGSQSKIYSLAVDGTSGWGVVKVTPSNTVALAAGETKALYIYLSAGPDAAKGEHMFSVAISSDSKVLKEIPLKANVVPASVEEEVQDSAGWDKVKRGLEIGLIVLVVLLVLLGLIVGFNKLKGNKEDEEGQTYY